MNSQAGKAVAPSPRVSVVLPTTRAWPASRAALDAYLLQIDDVDGEVIGVDSNGNGFTGAQNPSVRVVSAPGVDVVEARSIGAAAARGRYITVGEDHAVPRPGMLKGLIDLLEKSAENRLACTAVANASTKTPLDRANFFLTFAPFMKPLEKLGYDRSPLPGSVTFDAELLPEGGPSPGWMEYELFPTLVQRDQAVALSEALIDHVQSEGAGWTIVVHFQSGRSFTGNRALSWGWGERVGDLRRALGVPMLLWRQTQAEFAKRPAVEVGRRASTALALLILCNGAGQLVGLIFGPGNSSASFL